MTAPATPAVHHLLMMTSLRELRPFAGMPSGYSADQLSERISDGWPPAVVQQCFPLSSSPKKYAGVHSRVRPALLMYSGTCLLAAAAVYTGAMMCSARAVALCLQWQCFVDVHVVK